MGKKRFSIALVVLIFASVMCGCATKEQQKISNAKTIALYYGYSTKDNSAQGDEQYVISKREGKAEFSYYTLKTGDIIKCDVTNEVLDEIKKILSEGEISNYTASADSNGVLQHKTFQKAIVVRETAYSDEQILLITDLSKIDKIESKFQAILESAKKGS